VDDRALISAAQAGDSQALDRLLRNHYDRIWRLCRRMAGNDADAQDAAQEALIAIARGLPRFDGRAAFTTWTYRVATNACLDELRRRSRRPTPSGDDDTLAGMASAATPAVGRVDNSPDSHVADRLTIDSALRQLPEDYRAAVVLRDLCDLDYAEIATVLEIPPGTVRSRIARGRTALAGLLRERAPDPGNQQPSPQRPLGQP
jgi:RNA polymerase sigma-70 factor (ECF subfamily)